MTESGTEPAVNVEGARMDEERAATGALPAVYADTWYSTTWSGLIRLSFGEVLGEKTYYRNAIVMSLKDAALLAKHIQNIVERQKKSGSSETPEDDKPSF